MFDPDRIALILNQLTSGKTLEILKYLADEQMSGKVAVKELSEHLEIPISSLYRILGNLSSQGLIEREEEKGFVLTETAQKIIGILDQLDKPAKSIIAKIATQSLKPLGFKNEIIEDILEQAVEKVKQSPELHTLNRDLFWSEVHEGTKILAGKIRESGYKVDVILSISSGGAIIGGMLSRILDIPLGQIIRSNPSLEERNPEQSFMIAFPTEASFIIEEKPIRGNLLLVDDVVRSGYTLNEAKEKIAKIVKVVKEIKSAALLLVFLEDEDRDKLPPQKQLDFYAYTSRNFGIKMPYDRFSRTLI